MALLVALAMIVVSCGGSDDDDEGNASATPEQEEGNREEATPQSGPNTPEPRPLADRTEVTITAAAPVESLVSTLYVADAMGEFERENLDVTINIGLETNQALLELDLGRMQMAITGVSAATFNGVALGAVDARLVADVSRAGEESRDGLYIRNERLDADGEVDSSQVSGMRFAVGAAGVIAPLGLHVLGWLQQYDVTLDEVEFAPAGGPDILVALEQGSVDAAYLTSPFWQEESVAECCTLVTPVPPVSLNKYAFSADFLENDRDTAKAILRALMRTTRTYLEPGYHDDAEIMAILAEAMSVPAEALAQGPEHVFDPDLGVDADSVMDGQSLWLDSGQLEYDEPLDDDAILDVSIVEEILAE